MRNVVRPVLLAAVLVLALTGCVKVDADLKVGKDETVSGKLLLAVDKNAAEKLGTTSEKLREQIENSIKKDAPKGVDCKSYEEGNYIGTECSLDNVPFKEMSGSDDGDLKFEKQGDKFVVSGGTGDLASSLPNTEGLPKPDVKFKITMPGKILDHDDGAKVNGNTATYTDPNKMSKISLTSDSSGGGFPAWALILIIVLVLLAIAAVVFFLLRGRKSGNRQQLPGQQYPGQYPGQQGGQWGQPGEQGPQGGYPGQDQQWGQQGPQPGQQYGGQQGGQGPGQDQRGQQSGQPYGGQQGGPGQAPGQYGGQQGGPGQGQGPWGQSPQTPPNPQQGQQGQWGQQGQGGGPYGGQQGNPGQGQGPTGNPDPPQWRQPGQGPDDPGNRG